MRGSISVELVIILLVAVYLILAVNRGYLDSGMLYASDVDRVAAMRNSVEKLAAFVRSAGYAGVGTRFSVYIVVPPESRIYWDGNTVGGEVGVAQEYNACPNGTCRYEVNVPFTLTTGSITSSKLLVVEKVGPGEVNIS